jgi:hypothetical protein
VAGELIKKWKAAAIKKNKTPKQGLYFFAPAKKDNNAINHLFSMMDIAPTFVSGAPKAGEKNLPGLISPGYTPGSLPNNHTMPAGCSIWGAPFIPFLPKMNNFPSVPAVPHGMKDLITGIAGIPSMLKGELQKLVSFVMGLPIIPGIVNLEDMIYNFANAAEAETTLVQEIDVSLWRYFIDAGVQTFDFSSWYASNGDGHKSEIAIALCKESINVEDSTNISDLFKSGGKDYGKLAAVPALAYLSSGEYKGEDWKAFNLANVIIPPGTRKIYVFMRVWKSFDLFKIYYAGYFDNLKLTMPIYQIPITCPSTIIIGSPVKIKHFACSNITYQSLNTSRATVSADGTITATNTGNVTVKITDPVFQEVNNEVTFNVIQPTSSPVITRHPNDVVISAINQDARFIVEASGNPNPSYQWQISTDGGSSWNNVDESVWMGAKTNEVATYSLTNAMNGRKFRCLVSNSLGTVSSNVATLIVAIPAAPVITQQTPNETIDIVTEQSVIFTIVATGSALTYQWQTSPNGKVWTNVGSTYANTPNLSLNNITSDWNGFMYRCVVKNPGGTVTGNAATLIVLKPQMEDAGQSGQNNLWTSILKIIKNIVDVIKNALK